MIRRCFSTFLIVLSLIHSAFLAALPEQQKMGDRVLFEMALEAYTQREMEVYLLVKKLATQQGLYIVSGENWLKAIEEYRLDMLIEQDAKKMDRFNPQPQLIETMSQSLLKDAQNMSLYIHQQKRLGIDERSFQQALGSFLRVKMYRETKQKSKSLSHHSSSAQQWLDVLEKNSPYRMFSGSETYQHIEPNPWQKQSTTDDQPSTHN